MLKYKVIRAFVAIWCAVCLAYVGVRTSLGMLSSQDDAASAEEQVKEQVVEAPQEIPEESEEPEGVEEYEEPEPESEAEAEAELAPSLYEYLSRFTCGSCRRNCSLANPRCHNGSRLAEAKAQEYYELYG